MIYVTGDIHGDANRFLPILLPHSEEWTNEDYLLICGDFGFLFEEKRSKEYFSKQKVLDELEKKPFTICFCDGNHENFPLLFSYPEEVWHGGKIHRIRKNIIHLMRGQIFYIDGKSFFVMGGGYSLDRDQRTLNVSYWEEELPTNEEYHEASNNLMRANMSVDYVLTHVPPKRVMLLLMGKCNDNELELNGYLDWVASDVHFKQWYFGHLHQDLLIHNQYQALYFDVVLVR